MMEAMLVLMLMAFWCRGRAVNAALSFNEGSHGVKSQGATSKLPLTTRSMMEAWCL